jgi:hypothetical protein
MLLTSLTEFNPVALESRLAIEASGGSELAWREFWQISCVITTLLPVRPGKKMVSFVSSSQPSGGASPDSVSSPLTSEHFEFSQTSRAWAVLSRAILTTERGYLAFIITENWQQHAFLCYSAARRLPKIV